MQTIAIIPAHSDDHPLYPTMTDLDMKKVVVTVKNLDR